MSRIAFLMVLLVAVLIGTPGCQRNGTTTGQRPVVAVITPMTHPALDETIRGFREGLAESGYASDDVDVIVRNANGEMDKIPVLLRQMVESHPALIFSVTTPASIAATKVAVENNIPLVYAAVTDPVDAGIVTSMDRSDTAVTGVSDHYPVPEQVRLFVKLMPRMKSAGILYNPAEHNSRILADETEQALRQNGITPRRYQVMGSEDVRPRTLMCLREADAVIVNGDNLVVEHLDVVIKACVERGKPLFVGDPDSVRRGAVATVGPSYRAIGRIAGAKAAQVLGGTPAGSIASELPANNDYIINTRSAKAMGITIPPDFWQSREIWESPGL